MNLASYIDEKPWKCVQTKKDNKPLALPDQDDAPISIAQRYLYTTKTQTIVPPSKKTTFTSDPKKITKIFLEVLRRKANKIIWIYRSVDTKPKKNKDKMNK